MSFHYLLRSLFKGLLLTALLATAVLFDAGGSLLDFALRDGELRSGAQAANKDHTSLRLLKEVVPGADSFSEKEGEVPVYKAYRTDPESGEQTLLGYAFVSADTQPEPSGFSGPIDSLIGMDLAGNIVGLRVVYYKESLRNTWGDFLSLPGFQEQFVGKRAEDGFRVGKDVDGISKATISVRAMARGVRQSIRAVTIAYVR